MCGVCAVCPLSAGNSTINSNSMHNMYIRHESSHLWIKLSRWMSSNCIVWFVTRMLNATHLNMPEKMARAITESWTTIGFDQWVQWSISRWPCIRRSTPIRLITVIDKYWFCYFYLFVWPLYSPTTYIYAKKCLFIYFPYIDNYQMKKEEDWSPKSHPSQ